MEYKTARSRLFKIFENGRDNWRRRSNEKQKRIKSLEIKIRDLEKSRESWKKKCTTLKTELISIQKKELKKNARTSK